MTFCSLDQPMTAKDFVTMPELLIAEVTLKRLTGKVVYDRGDLFIKTFYYVICLIFLPADAIYRVMIL